MFAASNTYDNNYIFMNPDGFKNATGSYCGCAGRRPQTFGRPRCFLVVDEEIFEEPRRERFVVAAVVHSFVHLFVRSFAWLCGLVRCHSPLLSSFPSDSLPSPACGLSSSSNSPRINSVTPGSIIGKSRIDEGVQGKG